MNDNKFHLEINDFKEFVAFVAIIRGEDVDSEKIKALLKGLDQSSDSLNTAVNNAPK